MPLPTAITQAIDAAVEREAEDLLRLALSIHQHPELRFEEAKAAAWITELLESRQHKIERGLGGLPTALRARAGRPMGPRSPFSRNTTRSPGSGMPVGIT